MLDVLTLAGVVLTAIGAFGAAWAAYESHKTVDATKAVAEAALVRSFLQDYFSPSVSLYLRTLCQWKDKNGADFASTWAKQLSIGNAEAKDVDEARRFVKSYFAIASRLYSNGLISLKCYRAICDVTGNIIYYDIVDPLELALNPGRDLTTLEVMRKHIGRCNSAEQILSISPKSGWDRA